MKDFYQSRYRSAAAPNQLPWHRETIPPHLAAAVAQQTPGRVLDIGCGTGVYATYLAELGWNVTALDFVPTALNMAQERANEKGVIINFVEADVLEWKADGKFELILDAGCFHGFANNQRQVYKQRLLNWLAPQGKFVLTHFVRRSVFDWRPVGPRRRTRTEINHFFAPELVERSYWDNVIPATLPVGPTVKIGYYLFDGV
ncbi:class I SAM-dependent methyltransferase [[Phormidium] sp. ETS-05]|uniref:class I SAM-dependent methyltransferase n=1 Tax=[Phormidium] sp. ETS-05 TaxID=222819 RepID=UPI0018EEF3F4|nr:class I SAM-dependent methyltransferase [[Phormidium] sp. ETS-05]